MPVIPKRHGRRRARRMGDELADGAVAGRIMKVAAAPLDASWMWTLAYGYHKDRTPTSATQPTRNEVKIFLRMYLPPNMPSTSVARQVQ